jgi:hypothetical protein
VLDGSRSTFSSIFLSEKSPAPAGGAGDLEEKKMWERNMTRKTNHEQE